MTDLKKYYLVFLFKLFPLGKELGFNSTEQLRIDSPYHDELFKSLHYAVKNVIKDFGGLSYKDANAQAKEIKRGPNKSGTCYLESK
jgi:hypothetical protein